MHSTLNPRTNFCCRSKNQDRIATTVPPGLEFFKEVDLAGFYWDKVFSASGLKLVNNQRSHHTEISQLNQPVDWLAVNQLVVSAWWEYWLLTLSWRRSFSFRNQSIDFQSKSMDWFIYDRDLCHERVKGLIQYSKILSVTG